MEKFLTFLDRKFDLLLAAGLFILVFRTWVNNGFSTEVKDIMWILVGSVGTLLGVKGRDALMRKTDIHTDTIETPAVNADQITDSTVNTTSLNVRNKEGEKV